jgi:23S rRNA (pseudouridine1915-N3)-methyltransferase
MNWNIHPIGKPSFSWVRQGVAEYEKRIQRYAGLQLKPLKSFDALTLKPNGMLIVMDERGKGLSTQDLADCVIDLEERGVREITVCIGGADGVGEDLRKQADLVLSLGPQTLMHELALLVWMEQVYRVHTLMAGHPYHRDG